MSIKGQNILNVSRYSRTFSDNFSPRDRTIFVSKLELSKNCTDNSRKKVNQNDHSLSLFILNILLSSFFLRVPSV